MNSRVIAAVWGQSFFNTRLFWGFVKTKIIAAMKGRFLFTSRLGLGYCEVEGNCCCAGTFFLC